MEKKPIVPTNMGPSVQYCCVLLDQIKKHLCILYQEAQLLHNVEEEFTQRKTVFNKCSSSINNKLLFLWALSDQQPQDKTKTNMRHFLIQTTKNWKEMEEKIAQESVGVPIFSRTSPNVPLSTILEKMQYIADSTKFTFQTITAHFVCSRHAAYLYNEIMCAIARLSGYMTGARYSLLLSRLTPYLLKLDAKLEMVVTTGSCEGIQPPPGPSPSSGAEDSGQVEQCVQGEHSCFSGPTPPACRDPMYTIDGKLAPAVQVPPQLCAGPFRMPVSVRLQRLMRPPGTHVSPRAATAPANATTNALAITVKTEPPDPDAHAPLLHAVTRDRTAVDACEEDCDLLPIKMPRLESGLLTPLP